MKLFFSNASPYARKVLVLAHETNQTEDIELLDCAANPVNRDASIVAYNPTGKIPTLIMDNGKALYDSRVICQYLDSTHQGEKMYPEAGSARWSTLCLEALADGIMDAALLARYETAMRPAELQWQAWLDGQMEKIDSSMDQLQRDVANLSAIDAGQIASGCALGYLNFRFPDYDWQTRRPALADWFSTLSQRESMRSTFPEA